jgi:integrase/recombinase XerD
MSSIHASAAQALVPARQTGTDLTQPIRTADDLAAAFLTGYGPATRECYGRDLRDFGRFLTSHAGGVDPLDVRRAHVDLYVRMQEEAGVAPATLARRLSALSGFYAYALDEELIARSPVTRVRRPRVPDESPRLGVDRDGVRGILATAEASSPRDHALVALLCLNGLRISEALAADVTDVAHERGHRTLRLRRKGGKVQTVALPPRAAEAIDRLVAGRHLGPIFVTRSGRRLDRFAAAKTVTRLARVAGIEHRVSPHSLRHGFVTIALDAGVALHVVQDAAGHSSPTTTQRYNRRRFALDGHAAYAVAQHVA